MAKLTWDETGKRFYETGVSKGAIYPQAKTGAYETGVSWSGLVSVQEAPEGGEINPFYADNMKYLSIVTNETMNLSVEAYTYPVEFERALGYATPIAGVKVAQQQHTPFGFAYSTIKGNDTEGNNYSELIHIAYGCKASPSERQYQTVSDSVEPITFSFSLSCDTVEVPNLGHTSLLIIDTRDLGEDGTKIVKEKLYGTDSTEPTLPTPAELFELLKNTKAGKEAAKAAQTTSSPGQA